MEVIWVKQQSTIPQITINTVVSVIVLPTLHQNHPSYWLLFMGHEWFWVSIL